jgi:hypothetical protein
VPDLCDLSEDAMVGVAGIEVTGDGIVDPHLVQRVFQCDARSEFGIPAGHNDNVLCLHQASSLSTTASKTAFRALNQVRLIAAAGAGTQLVTLA